MIFPALFLAAATVTADPPSAVPAPVFAYAHHAVSTTDPQSQALFDRGLTLYYAYNGGEGARVFRLLEKREPKLAMAYWGEALSDGPDINSPLSATGFAAAHKAIEKARALASSAPPEERVFIETLRARYSGHWSTRKKAERAYRTAMAAAVAKFPDDDDLGALYVEALLEDRSTDGLWKSGTSQPQTAETSLMVRELDRIIARNPAHLMANHLIIHIFEPSTERARAVAAVNRMDAMHFAPEDEHLAHMSAHTWIDIGDYVAGVAASKRAIALFDTYRATPGIDHAHDRYLWHDLRVGWGASLMNGDYEQAQWFAKRLSASAFIHTPFVAFTAARFGRWAEIPTHPKNAADPLHFALAYSALQQGNSAAASSQLSDALKTKSPQTYLLYALRGAIDARAGRAHAADAEFKKALALEEDAYGGETLPFLATSELMGSTYASLGEYAKAQNAYRRALRSYQNDPFALAGLADILAKIQARPAHAQ